MNKNPVLSLCLIARNSARTLGACLASIRPWVDEMIVVDTGSDDETSEIARSYGARVFDFEWCDDFSAARNESLRHARGQWLLWMDSDDTIDEANGCRLRELAYGAHPPNLLGFVMQVHCPGPRSDGEVDCTVVDHVKLIRNLPDLRFNGRIHEQVLPAIRRLGGEVEWTDTHVVHSGSDQSPAGRTRKQERDLRILLLELAERPEHPFTLFNLGMTYADMEDYPKAIDFLNRSIAVSGTADSHLRKAYALLVNSYAQNKQFVDAKKTCDRGCALFPDDPELLFRRAMLAHHGGRLIEAEYSYLQLFNIRRERCFSSMDSGIQGFKARHNLATVYQDMNREELAELQWRQVVQEVPHYRLGWRGLLECLLKNRRYQTCSLEIEHLLTVESLRCTALLMRAQLTEIHGDHASAKQDILAAIHDYPDEIELREALCKFLFHHGDPIETERALQDLATRLPESGAVLHNLGSINMRLGRYTAAVDAYQASLQVRPESPSTLRELGCALVALGRSDESSTILDKADLLLAIGGKRSS